MCAKGKHQKWEKGVCVGRFGNSSRGIAAEAACPAFPVFVFDFRRGG